MSRQNRSSATEVAAFRTTAKLLVPENAKYVVQVFYFPDEPGDEGSVKVEKLGPKGLVNRAVSAYREDGAGEEPPKDLSGVLGWVSAHYEGDGTWCSARLATLKDYRKAEEERERSACERLAAEIVSKYKVKPNSLAFIAAVHKHYDRIADAERHFREDGESRMERWGRASMNGNSEGFWSDQDYSSSLEHAARDKKERLLRYCQKYLPLLMARWEERKLRRKK